MSLFIITVHLHKFINKLFSRLISAPIYVFLCFWLLVFALYLPAAHAGRVTDYLGWLDQTVRYGFWDNILRTHYSGKSLYYFTQFVTWCLYQVIHNNAWGWHLVSVSMHATNGFLLFLLVKQLLEQLQHPKAFPIAFVASIIFLVWPTHTEVVVWESSFHYLLGLLMLLTILKWATSYIITQKPIYSIGILGLYMLSSFSIEVFYITPWLMLIMAWAMMGRQLFLQPMGRLFLRLCLGCLSVFVGHLLLFQAVFHQWVAHIGSKAVIDTFGGNVWFKSAKQLFQMLWLGRSWPVEWQKVAYTYLETNIGVTLFYSFHAVLLCLLYWSIKKQPSAPRLLVALVGMIGLTMFLILPLWFQGSMHIVYDRYYYFSMPFVAVCFSLALNTISKQYIKIIATTLFLVWPLRYTHYLVQLWQQSDTVVSSLLNQLPTQDKRPILLLNNPQTLQGAAMIGADVHSEFGLMHRLFLPEKPLPCPVYDVMAYNMLTTQHGAHVTVLNDSSLKVTLNQFGTWWWYAMNGGTSYSNALYSVNMTDVGHEYILTLKQPATAYQIYFQVGSTWHQVQWQQIGKPQY